MWQGKWNKGKMHFFDNPNSTVKASNSACWSLCCFVGFFCSNQPSHSLGQWRRLLKKKRINLELLLPRQTLTLKNGEKNTRFHNRRVNALSFTAVEIFTFLYLELGKRWQMPVLMKIASIFIYSVIYSLWWLTLMQLLEMWHHRKKAYWLGPFCFLSVLQLPHAVGKKHKNSKDMLVLLAGDAQFGHRCECEC